MKSFNAWFEPWIPVEKTEGLMTQIGIFEALKDSHNIKAVRGAMPTDTFGIIRLLITILMDIYKPERWKDIENIQNNGKFDVEKLEKYYDLCISEGASFDLFDAGRPFLQYPFKDTDMETKFAANIFDHVPTGNNAPHFVHNSEDSYAFTPQRCLQALCSIPFYEKHKRGKKVITGINGTPPIYFLFNGNTLFETLVSSLFPKSQYSENDYGKPIWRDFDCYDRYRQSFVTPDLLHAMFSAPLKIKLIPSDDGLIREVFFDEGIDYKDIIWTDPHVAYINDRNNEKKALMPKNGRAVWRDLPVIISPNAIKILYNVENRLMDKSYALLAFVRFCEFKGMLFMPRIQYTEELNIPVELLENKIKRDCYAKAVSVSDSIANECGYSLKTKLNGEGLNSYAEVLQDVFTQVFLSEIKETFDKTLISLLDKADTDTSDWEERISGFLAKEFRSAATNALNAALNTISDENVDTLILKTKLRNKVYKNLNYILKKGGYSYDNAGN